MKQKYTILKDNDNKQLVIKEFAELDKEILSLQFQLNTKPGTWFLVGYMIWTEER